ncbi:MAG: hypothetical protein ACOX9C_10980 [Kiritimatiellia bacterium]|jgi:hypothetical protein
MNKRIGNPILRTFSSIALLLAVTAAVRAELLVYEGFDYAATGDAGGGGGLTNGHGWAKGSHWTRENSAKDALSITAGSLAYGNVVTTGNKFELRGSNGRYSNRPFAKMIDSTVSDVVWGGIVMKTPPSSKTGRTSRFKLNGGGAAQFYVFADSATTIVVGGGSATEINTGISSGGGTRFYLYKIDLGEAEPVARLWISPSDFSSEAALGAPSVTITNIGSVYSSFSLGNSGGNPAQYDEVRIGTTLEDAWKTLPPQPTVIIVQ